MKRESHTRRTLATAVVILILLTVTPIYGRGKKEKNRSEPITISRLLLWVQSRLTPPMPEPEPGAPDNGQTTDTVTTDTTDTTDPTVTPDTTTT